LPNWLVQKYSGMSAPDITVFEKESTLGGVWAKSRAYAGSYIDELMRDMGLQTRRSDSFFEEYWGPMWGKRYRERTAAQQL